MTLHIYIVYGLLSAKTQLEEKELLKSYETYDEKVVFHHRRNNTLHNDKVQQLSPANFTIAGKIAFGFAMAAFFPLIYRYGAPQVADCFGTPLARGMEHLLEDQAKQLSGPILSELAAIRRGCDNGDRIIVCAHSHGGWATSFVLDRIYEKRLADRVCFLGCPFTIDAATYPKEFVAIINHKMDPVPGLLDDWHLLRNGDENALSKFGKRVENVGHYEAFNDHCLKQYLTVYHKEIVNQQLSTVASNQECCVLIACALLVLAVVQKSQKSSTRKTRERSTNETKQRSSSEAKSSNSTSSSKADSKRKPPSTSTSSTTRLKVQTKKKPSSDKAAKKSSPTKKPKKSTSKP